MKSGTLYICGMPWRFSLTREHQFLRGIPAHAIIDRHALTVTVSTSGTDEEQLRAVYWYEACRAIFETVNNGYPDDEDTCVQVLGTGWYSIAADKRNRWFLEQVVQ